MKNENTKSAGIGMSEAGLPAVRPRLMKARKGVFFIPRSFLEILFEIVGGMIPLFAGGLIVCVFLTSLLPETWANRPPGEPIKNTCAVIFLGLWIVLGLRSIRWGLGAWFGDDGVFFDSNQCFIMNYRQRGLDMQHDG
jgi:hypothetical protein